MRRVVVAASAGIVAYALVYVVTDYASLPHFYYDQLAHTWRLAGRLSGLPSGYVGLWLWAALAGAATGGLAFTGLRLRKAEPSDRALGLWVAWALTAVVLALGYYTWHNWP